ncbi:putative kinase [Klebsiella pneumoniae]|nr:putative kinase [Klebsiella pneumoniae]
MYWQALRGRLLTRPSSYPGVSLMAVTVETGGEAGGAVGPSR